MTDPQTYNSPHALQFLIGGKWADPHGTDTLDVINPSTGQPCARIAMGNAQDVDDAVRAAHAAFPRFSATTREDRLALLERVLAGFRKREKEIAEVLTMEMGAPASLSLSGQTASGAAHLEKMIEVLRTFQFREMRGSTLLVREPIGVVALITPWNWPINQIACKVAPALAAGCTMVLKPSEVAPLNAVIFAEILQEAGAPPGVFNLVHGDGPLVGTALSTHPLVDMVSITGSTRAGIAVAKAAADSVKRVHQELGGKSANIILPDADLEPAVRNGVDSCMLNTGQSCDAPTRMLVDKERYSQAVEVAKQAAEAQRVGNPGDEQTTLGPLVSQTQFDRVQAMIEMAMAEGARLVTGGPGRPADLSQGYFTRPTVFADVTPGMRIAREEVFGPVLVMMRYDTEEEAIRIANDSDYGLAAYVQGTDQKRILDVAAQLRAGNVHLNYPAWDTAAPFGGFKQSGNGREYGEFGLAEFLEFKAVMGAQP
ncbi:aldehyde dehydrogenase [Mesorhizobium sp. 113-3-9]|uniref:aldehyde dehydrogenase family protein n=1 Tax=Mesorhizobium sp. 113-3-9 TaxID=2744517 RepID=UPI001928629D|nr:aldehyde dehydrogenase family protein [Mesorhizobium sp. 113-3-9]BCG86703.1 aldehyde dehydrogenase [Mesorhizobium sp. 113-3-9]